MSGLYISGNLSDAARLAESYGFARTGGAACQGLFDCRFNYVENRLTTLIEPK